MKGIFEFIGLLNDNLEHIMKNSISTFILMTIVTLAGCDNQGTIPNVLAQIEGSHNQLEITCKRLTLVDNEGTPRLTLFTDSKTGDPGITMSGNSGRLHMHLGTYGVRIDMAAGPGEARITLEADDSEASITLTDENGRIELVPPRK